jgi:pimeloyl-ACP methyl ester carboxylesterase
MNQEAISSGSVRAMWPLEDWPGFVARWRAACAADAVLEAFAGPWESCFAIACDDAVASFRFAAGRVTAEDGTPAFTVAAPAAVWEKFLADIPPRHHHVVLAMLARVPAVRLAGDALAFAQSCHLVRRVLEIGKWLARGRALPVPPTLRPPAPPTPAATIAGGYAPVPLDGAVHDVFYEAAGSGRDILCLHTAGSDARQFHRLMADPRLTARHRLVAFDLPWHGRSTPPAGALPGTWRMTTDRYVAIIMGFVAAAGLNRPIVLGASMSGEICLELAWRFPDAFRAIVACEACDHVPGRQTPWSWHPAVNQTLFVPEWINGLMAPQSPDACAADILWHYAQGGPGVFWGDIHFYSGEWDARDRVGRIDTARCPLFMLTGEYDYSCTMEMSAATAAKIAGAEFRPMPGLGHFPFAENPTRFAEFLLPILDGLN